MDRRDRYLRGGALRFDRNDGRELKNGVALTDDGIADLRGKCDQYVIRAMLNITDTRFQEELLAEAAGPDAVRFPEIMKELPTEIPDNLQPFMARMELSAPATPEEIQTHKMLLLAFRLAGFC